MSNSITNEKQDVNNTQLKKENVCDNTIKVGTFQLQTKSFWISLVALLVLFLLSIVWLNTYYWYKICNSLVELNKTTQTQFK